MNFREWLINEKQSAEANRNRAPGRLLNVGPTRDYTQDFRSPARTPFWAQILTSLVSAMGGLMNKKLYGKSGIGRPQTPTTFLEPSLWTPESEKKKNSLSFKIDITNQWYNGQPEKGWEPLESLSKEEREIAYSNIMGMALNDPEIKKILDDGIPDGEGGTLNPAINAAQYVVKTPKTGQINGMAVMEIKVPPEEKLYKPDFSNKSR